MKIAAAGAVENVGKAERFLRSFFQAPGGNHQEEVAEGGPYLISTGATFSTALRARRLGFVVRKTRDTPPPLRINLTDCYDG